MEAEFAATVAVGAVAVTALAVIAARQRGLARTGTFAAAVGFLLWMAALVGLFSGLPSAVYWGVARPVTTLIFCAAFFRSEGDPLTGRDWFELMLEGWLSVGGVFGLAWMLADNQHLVTHRAPIGVTMLWLLVQVALFSTVCGLAMRAAPGYRLGRVITALVGLTTLVGDTFALVTGHPKAGIPFWLAGLAGTTLAFALAAPRMFGYLRMTGQPGRLRWWQLPFLYCLLYCVLPIHRDTVLNVTTIVLVGATFVQLTLESRRTEGLWNSLLHRTERYEELLLDSQDVIIQIGRNGIVEFANPATARVLRMTPEEIVGTRMRDYLHPDDRGHHVEVLKNIDWTRHSYVRLEGRLWLRKDADEPVRDEAAARWTATARPGGARPGGVTPPVDPDQPGERPQPAPQTVRDGLAAGGESPTHKWKVVEWMAGPRGEGGWIMTGRDVSDRVRLQDELLAAARTDSLTGLLNRAAFLDVVNARLQSGGGAAVLFIDLDDFKEVNDTMGHAEGDRLLRAAAETLRQAVGPDDAVARLGGDEFAVLPGSRAAEAISEAVITAFNGFDESALGRRSVSASVGVVQADAGTATELLRDADLAMYRAKQRGGGVSVLFEPWMSERVMEHSRLRADLEIAVRDESLTIFLQPVVDLNTRQWDGFEALVRWPVGAETWTPAQFLPVAEESGLIVPMGAWVLREALRQLAGWRDGRLTMAVNIAAAQLVGTDFYDVTMDALAASGVSPDRLILEITEQAAIQDLGRTASRLEALRSEGIHVAIDDFGTGFSSLQYLSRLPVDILKIDRKFVWGLGQHAEDDVLVRSMLGLAADLGLEVIAEGVETHRQAELLVEYGCRLAQGFLFSPPRPIEELRSSDPFVSPAPGGIPFPRGLGLPASPTTPRL